MSRSCVKVVLRVRPSDEKTAQEQQQLVVNPDSKTVTIVNGGHSSVSLSGLPSHADAKAGPAAQQQHQFKFDGILHNASQADVFELCAADVIQSALQGCNGAILCYGQTGAGKTFTMSGSRQSFGQRGLIPRAITATLAQLGAAPGLSRWRLGVSYLEIYNESLFDLLDLATQPHELAVVEGAGGQVAVSGLRRVEVTSEAQALALLFEGESNRVIGQHQLNRESSRSHSVFMLHLGITRQGEEGQELVSKVCLVDLAGSERVSKTRSEGLLLREAGHINKSLHILEQVVLAASEPGRGHVPYRSSKLTAVLRDSLGGNCKTVLIANVWGDTAQISETLSTCRFAARMARLVCEVRSNVVSQSGPRLRALQREVADLKEELAMMDLMHQVQQQQQQADGSGGGGRFTPFSAAQRARLRELVLGWLQQPDPSDEPSAAAAGDAGAGPVSVLSGLPLGSVQQLRELLLAFRGVVRDALQASSRATQPQLQQAAAGSAAAVISAAGDARWQEYVGDGDDLSGMSAAPDDARPGGAAGNDAAAGPGPGSSALMAEQQQCWGGGSRQGTPGRGSSAGSMSAAGGDAGQFNLQQQHAATGLPDRAAALEEYRAGPGAAQVQLLSDNHSKLRAAKRRSKDLALAVNGLKRRLDKLKQQQEELRLARQANGPGDETAQVLGLHEYQLLLTIRDVKAQYRDMHAELSLVRDEAGYTAGLLEACQAELAGHFEAWLAATHPALAATTWAAQQGSAAGSLLWAAGSLGRPDSSSSSAPLASSSPASAAGSSSAGTLKQRQHREFATEGSSSSAAGGPGSRQATPPLASLLCDLQCQHGCESGNAAAADPQAAAFYQAQAAASSRLLAGGAGAVKKHRGERGTFSLSERSQINDA